MKLGIVIVEKGKTMARDIIEGESIYIPFRNGRSINDTKHKARMYRTKEAFEMHFPGDEYGTDEVVLLEYAPVVRGGWIPVTERMPVQGQEVIVYTGGTLKPCVMGYFFWNPEYYSWARVTHWMPLPEPPKEE